MSQTNSNNYSANKAKKNKIRESVLTLFVVATVTLSVTLTADPAFAKRVKITDEHIQICEGAAAFMEEKYDIPDNIMHGIVRTESSSYPWVINWSGNGEFYDTKQEVIDRVRQLQSQGKKSIDVGCAQINLHWHPNAFDNLEEAFDPIANLDYAARHVLELKTDQNFSSWHSAVAMYHSGKRKSDRGDNYARIVFRLIKKAPGREPYVYDGNKVDGGRPSDTDTHEETHNMEGQVLVAENKAVDASERTNSDSPHSDSTYRVTISTRGNPYDPSEMFPYQFDMNEFFGVEALAVNPKALSATGPRVSGMAGVIGNLR